MPAFETAVSINIFTVYSGWRLYAKTKVRSMVFQFKQSKIFVYGEMGWFIHDTNVNIFHSQRSLSCKTARRWLFTYGGVEFLGASGPSHRRRCDQGPEEIGGLLHNLGWTVHLRHGVEWWIIRHGNENSHGEIVDVYIHPTNLRHFSSIPVSIQQEQSSV